MQRRGRGSAVHAGLSIAAIAVATFAGTAWAQEPAAQGDAKHGKAISYTCLGCHGIDGYKNAYPMYSVPKLAGQHQDYLVRAIDEYRKGGRKNPVMKGFAATLKDEDVAVIAQYFSRLTPAL